LRAPCGRLLREFALAADVAAEFEVEAEAEALTGVDTGAGVSPVDSESIGGAPVIECHPHADWGRRRDGGEERGGRAYAAAQVELAGVRAMLRASGYESEGGV
jgi:hypothetical protein